MKYRKVDVGLYLTADGSLHIDIPELLDDFGVEDTEENRDMCLTAVQEVAEQLWPDVPFLAVGKLKDRKGR